MFKIEKGVPRTNFKRGRKKIYPFESMSVGDSFAVPVESESPSAVSNRVRTAAAQAGKRLGMKFEGRICDGRDAVRVWRIA